ncbi:MAG: PEP-CTERM sorting domain-containing protein [Azoarcus sp.]|jgi:hypothetical protein|nr:PEP-CTERM sorting domain-containing protein [Azoarcus sp.]
MKSRFNPSLIALALSAGAFLLAAPMVQAKERDPLRLTHLDKFDEKATINGGQEAKLGGTLYVADPNKPVVFTFIADDDLFHNDKTYYWRDGLDGDWQVLFNEDKFKSYKKGTSFSEALDVTSDQVFFAISVNYTTLNKAERGVYGWSTGNGDLNWAPAAFKGDEKAIHSYVFYDYGTANTALVGFEDTRRFIAADWDDAIFTVSNVKATPAPEPEAYAMMLAGLGVVGAVARRRRRMSGV